MMQTLTPDQVRNFDAYKMSKDFLTAAELKAKTFPPLKVLVDPVITEGVTILAGREKIGKSWLLLDVAIAVCEGTAAAGCWLADQHDVLVLALEDGEKRLQRRLQKLIGNEPWPENLYLKTEAPRLDDGLDKFLKTWTERANNPGLVIIDTLQLIRPIRRDQRYADDTADLKALKVIADDLDVAIVLIHHLRKAAADGDAFDMISGSTGLAAGADATIVVQRHPSNEGFELYMRGRDVPEQEIALTFDNDACRWSATNKPADVVFRSDERGEILRAIEQLGEGKPSEVADLTEKPSTAVRKTMTRMRVNGELRQVKYGVYALPLSHQSQCHTEEGE